MLVFEIWAKKGYYRCSFWGLKRCPVKKLINCHISLYTKPPMNFMLLSYSCNCGLFWCRAGLHEYEWKSFSHCVEFIEYFELYLNFFTFL